MTFRLFLAAVLLGLASAAPAAPPPPVFADDGATIDSLVAELYAVISGPRGTRDWVRFRRLFVPEGRLVPTGVKGPHVLTVEQFVAAASTSVAREGFYEREIARRTERYGNIAHLFSTYESRHAPGEAPFARGINSIQLVRVGGSWRVLSIFWQAETPVFPIPVPYLPTNAEPAK